MMKKTFLMALCLSVLTGASAKEVSDVTASAKALEILQGAVSGFQGKVQSVVPVYSGGQKVYYAVQFAPQGWALVSADDTTEPLIGYSAEGKYVMEGQPESMTALLDCFAQKVIARKKMTVQQVADGWETGAQNRAKVAAKASGKEKVEALIQVNWNQSGKYQKYCPKNSEGQAIVGCVAVGMAQAMSVAQWPERPTGEFSYNDPTYGTQYINYDNEPAYNWSDILSGANDKDDVARLLWHCGVSVKMNYGVNGSGTQDSYIASALKRNFSYPQSVKYVKRSSYDGNWEDLVYQELSEGRAVCLSGQDTKQGYGHCFNLDGYDNGAFHVNWGWGGANNGMYALSSLKDNGYDYSDAAYQSLIIGIRRPSDKPSDIILGNQTVEAGLPAGTVVGTIEVVNEATTPPTYTYTFKGAYNPFTHKYAAAPFDVVDGNLVTTDVLSEKVYTVTITATDFNKNSVTRTFAITAKASSGISGVDQDVQPLGVTYYNMEGAQLQSAANGVNIVVYRYSDGTKKVSKLIVK